MGTVTQREADIITAVAAKVPGVVKVVTLMEIITPEELERRKLIKENPSAVTEKNGSPDRSRNNSYKLK